jgi:DNA replication protein DnaC
MFSNKMSFDIIRTFMAARAVEITRKELVLDDDNSDVFDLLCYYFIDDEEGFLKKCRLLEVNNPDIKKGILLAGNVGTGKTYLMDLFRKNQRQVYFTRDSKKIVNDFMAAKDDEIPEEYLKPFMLRINDPQTLYQPCAGMCIDDLGKETMKNKYGNKMNVIGDLIEERYSAGYTGVFLHATTNLSVPELTDHYGERVVSRISETFNMIVLEGNDRRRG